MSYLLYCIFRGPAQPSPGMPPGVRGKPVFVLSQNGLSAGFSELAESDTVPDVAQLLAYEAVIEHFYGARTVIPVRYGCQLKDTSEALQLLERHRDEYAALLAELEGLTEMGIHVLPDRSRPGTESPTGPAAPQPVCSLRECGAAYLAAQRQHYLGLDRAALRERSLVEELWTSLAGLYVRRKLKPPDSNRGCLLSLYFLVPRASVEPFRHAAHHFRSREPIKMLLSGPWPPYNFVDSLGR